MENSPITFSHNCTYMQLILTRKKHLLNDLIILITGDGIIEHFQDSHNGPLIQYFQSPIKLKLEDLLHGKHETYLITIAKQIFILKSLHIPDE